MSSVSMGLSRTRSRSNHVAGSFSVRRFRACVEAPSMALRRCPPTAFFVLTLLVVARFTVSPVVAASASSAPSVDDLLARHHDALGKLPALVARWSGTILENGQEAHYEITAARDGRFRQVFKFPLAERSQGSNGSVDWQEDENGNIETIPAETHASMDERLVRLNDVRFDARHSALSGSTQLDGRRVYVLNTIVGKELSVIYIDAATWLIDGADLGQRSVRYHAYRTCEGVPVPSHITESDGSFSLDVTVDDCTFKGVRQDFNPPSQREPQFPAGIKQVTLNFQSPSGLIVIPARINDRPVHLLVDSGSTTSVIDADLARRWNMPTGGVARVQGAGMLTGTVAKLDSLDINGIRFAPFYMEAVPLSLPAPIAHEGIDGVVGYDLLAPLVMRISYRHFALQFIAPDAFSYNGNGQILPIDLSKRIALASASLGQDDRGTFTVDTGSDAQVVLYRAFADANRRDFVNPYIFDQDLAAGAGGEFPTRITTITRLNLGKYSLPDLVAQVVMREAGAFGSTDSDGIVGGGALQMFDAVFFDYPDKRVILER